VNSVVRTLPEPLQPLDGVDVRKPDGDDAVEHPDAIELATFCDGAYVESIFLDRKAAEALWVDLGLLLLEVTP
jgi:hypothetical protein